MDDTGIGRLFGRIFGFPSARRSDIHDRSDWNEEQEGHPDLRDHPLGDESRRFPGGGDDLDSMFEHFHQDIWRNMESLHRQMDEMMRGCGAVDFPSGFDHPLKGDDQMLPNASPPNNPHSNDSLRIWFGTPSPFFRSGGDQGKRNPREHMLKEDEPDPPCGGPARPALPPPPPSGSPHKPFFSTPRWGGREIKKDSDLDGKLSDQEVLDIITKRSDPGSSLPASSQPIQPAQPRMSSWGKSVSITRFRGPDGKVEERRVCRDSQGREETTVTKSVGDQSHTVTTVTGRDGQQETSETFHNMDQKDKGEFDAQWNTPSTGRLPSHPADALMPPPQIDSRDRDIFSKLFGWK